MFTVQKNDVSEVNANVESVTDSTTANASTANASTDNATTANAPTENSSTDNATTEKAKGGLLSRLTGIWSGIKNRAVSAKDHMIQKLTPNVSDMIANSLVSKAREQVDGVVTEVVSGKDDSILAQAAKQVTKGVKETLSRTAQTVENRLVEKFDDKANEALQLLENKANETMDRLENKADTLYQQAEEKVTSTVSNVIGGGANSSSGGFFSRLLPKGLTNLFGGFGKTGNQSKKSKLKTPFGMMSLIAALLGGIGVPLAITLGVLGVIGSTLAIVGGIISAVTSALGLGGLFFQTNSTEQNQSELPKADNTDTAPTEGEEAESTVSADLVNEVLQEKAKELRFADRVEAKRIPAVDSQSLQSTVSLQLKT